MASTVGLVPISRAYLSKFYESYPFAPLSPDVSLLSSLLKEHYLSMDSLFVADQPGERSLVGQLEFEPPHKIDENLWKNREQIEEILHLLGEENLPSLFSEKQTGLLNETAASFDGICLELKGILRNIKGFQSRSAEKVFDMVTTYLPQDFRCTLIKQQRERSEKRRQAEVEALVSSGGSIRDRYALLWKQQMERRRQLAQLGNATGVYKTLVKYLAGVPQVLLDFVRQINDHHGPMEEQRQRYGPPLYQLTILVTCLRIYLTLWWRLFEKNTVHMTEMLEILEKSVKIYISEMNRFLTFMGEVFENSPFLISAEDACAAEGRQIVDDYKETIIANGKTHEVLVAVEYEGTLVAWDFQLTSGKDVGFSVEYTDASGQKLPMLPYQRYESNQGNFYSPHVGTYKLIWDNTYSTFYRKYLRFKVDAIPPVETRADVQEEAVS